jgi:hypothetical protein
VGKAKTTSHPRPLKTKAAKILRSLPLCFSFVELSQIPPTGVGGYFNSNLLYPQHKSKSHQRQLVDGSLNASETIHQLPLVGFRRLAVIAVGWK